MVELPEVDNNFVLGTEEIFFLISESRNVAIQYMWVDMVANKVFGILGGSFQRANQLVHWSMYSRIALILVFLIEVKTIIFKEICSFLDYGLHDTAPVSQGGQVRGGYAVPNLLGQACPVTPTHSDPLVTQLSEGEGKF